MSLTEVAAYYQLKLATQTSFPSKEEEVLQKAFALTSQLLADLKRHPGISDSDAADIIPKCQQLSAHIQELITVYKGLSRAQVYDKARVIWNSALEIEQRIWEELSSSQALQDLTHQIEDIVYQTFKDWQPGLLPVKKKK